MKKAFNLFIFPLMAGIVVALALNTFIHYTGSAGTDGLSLGGTHYAFILLGFLFGFMPCFIVGYAAGTLAALRPAERTEVAPEHNIYVGKVITSIGANCQLRVKSVKIPLFSE